MQYSTFYINNNYLGIPIYLVKEYTHYRSISRVPSGNPFLTGLMDLRGRIASVIDIASIIGGEIGNTKEETDNRKMIILETGDDLPEDLKDMGIEEGTEPIVLLVDRVGMIISSDNKTFHEKPANIKEDFIEEVIFVDNKLLTIISIKKIIRHIFEETKE